jgi:hypothetical protein
MESKVELESAHYAEVYTRRIARPHVFEAQRMKIGVYRACVIGAVASPKQKN